MEKENILLEIRDKPKVLLELPTSYGKTKLAIDYLIANNVKKPLIVTPALVIENGWKTDQLPKWDTEHKLNPTFIQYASFIDTDKVKNIDFDSLVLDEAHHITDKFQNTIFSLSIMFRNKPIIMLSATINSEKRELLNETFNDYYTVKVSTAKAIQSEKLPTPTIMFIKCKLGYADTAMYQTMNTHLEYFKQFSDNSFYRIKMKRQAKDIYEWLSDKKIEITKILLFIYRQYRTLTFCSNIEQCNNLGANPVHSKNKKSKEIVENFNNNKIKHLTSCRVLLEGVNLYNCRVGIFNYLSPTFRIQTQAFGRILRHNKPIIIFPYFENTRDEVIINKLYKQYKNSAKIIVTTMDKVKEIYNERKIRRTRKTNI